MEKKKNNRRKGKVYKYTKKKRKMGQITQENKDKETWTK